MNLFWDNFCHSCEIVKLFQGPPFHTSPYRGNDPNANTTISAVVTYWTISQHVRSRDQTVINIQWLFMIFTCSLRITYLPPRGPTLSYFHVISQTIQYWLDLRVLFSKANTNIPIFYLLSLENLPEQTRLENRSGKNCFKINQQWLDEPKIRLKSLTSSTFSRDVSALQCYQI